MFDCRHHATVTETLTNFQLRANHEKGGESADSVI